MSASPTATEITPSALLDRLAAGEPIVLLDVRGDGADAPSAPSASVTRVAADDAVASAERLARELPDDVVVVCNRGISARRVAEALRREGSGAVVLEGGMRGWIGALRAVPVELDVPGLEARQVQRPGRGCLSYLLAAGGEALVVDPAPDAAFYVELAASLGARVTRVLDTHVHADHLSGARELAAATGAALLLPRLAAERGVTYADEAKLVADGETFALGGVELRVVALPGHTTDMTGLLVAGRALLSGDSLFADGIARPDLQQGDPAGARAMARTLYTTLRERVLTLGDEVVLLPGHDHPGVRATAVAPTLAEVRAAVPELALEDPDAFADELLRAMPPRPANYEAVIAVNSGRAPLDPELERGGNSCATRA